MSTESGWGDYLSSGTDAMDTTATSGMTGFEASIEPVIEPVVAPEPVIIPDPVADAVESDLGSAAGAQDWSDWHAASGDSWAASAQDYLDYAQQSLADGYVDAANSAMETAANHAAIGDSNFAIADDYATSAGSYVDAAAQELAPYDSGTSFDSGTSVDLAE